MKPVCRAVCSGNLSLRRQAVPISVLSMIIVDAREVVWDFGELCPMAYHPACLFVRPSELRSTVPKFDYTRRGQVFTRKCVSYSFRGKAR